MTLSLHKEKILKQDSGKMVNSIIKIIIKKYNILTYKLVLSSATGYPLISRF